MSLLRHRPLDGQLFAIKIAAACADLAAENIDFPSQILEVEPDVLRFGPEADLRTVQLLEGTQRIELHFPKWTDGRAFTQAVQLRRSGFTGDIRALGDVLIDQLWQMQRCGFTSAHLRADQNEQTARAVLAQSATWYARAYQANPAAPKELAHAALGAA